MRLYREQFCCVLTVSVCIDGQILDSGLGNSKDYSVPQGGARIGP